MARKGNGSNQEVRFARGAISAQPTAFWLAALVRIDNAADNVWQALISGRTVALADRRWLERTDTGLLQFGFVGVGGSQYIALNGPGLTDSEGWTLCFGTYNNSGRAARVSRYVFATGAWSHTTGTMTGTLAPETIGSDGIFQIGEFNASDDLNGAVQMWAAGAAELTQDQIESTVAGPLAVLALPAVEAMVMLDQSATTQLARDLTGGGADEDTGNSSMTVDTGSSCPWGLQGRIVIPAFSPAAGGDARSGSSSVSAGGSVSAAAAKGGRAVSTASSGGAVTSACRKGGRAAGACSSGGSVASATRKGALSVSSVRGGGTVSSFGTSAEAHSGTSTCSGGGTLTASGRKGARAASAAGSGGQAIASARKATSSATAVGGGGSLVSTGRSARASVSLVRGGGTVTTASFSGAPVIVTAPFDSPNPGGRTSSSPRSAAFDQPEPVGEPG